MAWNINWFSYCFNNYIFNNECGFKMKDKYMILAYKEAQKAFEEDEVPVGCVIVKDDKVIAKAHNKKEKKNCAIYHAEIECIKKATKKLKNWNLKGCDIYVTLEPCMMCSGAIINSRIRKVYIGTSDEKTGAVGSVLNLFNDFKFNHKPYIPNVIRVNRPHTM